MDHVFFYGRTPAAALAELNQVVLALFPGSVVTDQQKYAVVSGLEFAQAKELQHILGSTVKVASILHTNIPAGQLQEKILEILQTQDTQTTLDFSVSPQFGAPGQNLGALKDALRSVGRKARYIESEMPGGLSASVLLHHPVVELLILPAGVGFHICQTVSVQDIDAWSARDRGRPGADREHGMLPPKIARTMINLAVPNQSGRILDPFCGAGTILVEGLDLGLEVIGGDIRQDAVDQAIANCQWYCERLHVDPARAKVALLDATHIKTDDLGGPITAIVAEGYLGPQQPTVEKLPDIFKGLTKLYKGAFKQWATFLTPGTRICIALPQVAARGQIYSLRPLIDSLEEFGYNTVIDPIVYAREAAIVKREIFILEFKKN